jgi:hypothetical protein
MTEHHSQRARPFHAETGDASRFASLAYQPAQQRFGRGLRVGARHGIATQQKDVRLAGGDKAMQEKAAITPGEHDLTGPEVFERAACDFHQIARPKSGQHAFPVNLQTQTTTETQSFGHQS